MDPDAVDIEWRISPSLLRALLAAGILSICAAVALWWLSAPVAETRVPAHLVRAQTTTAAGLERAVLVDVVGAVRRPGVVRLPSGARVLDAIMAAGGVLPHRLPVINLARTVIDGEQIVVGRQESQGVPAADSASMSGTATQIDVNHATVSELDALPGIGPVLAQRIVAYRTQHGSFARTRDLLNVTGIGDAKFADLSAAVRAG